MGGGADQLFYGCIQRDGDHILPFFLANVLRAQNLGVSMSGIMLMLIVFSLIYSAVSTPAGSLSDRVGRRRLISGGWVVYALIYFDFAAVQTA